jgi:hypothetical protein
LVVTQGRHEMNRYGKLVIRCHDCYFNSYSIKVKAFGQGKSLKELLFEGFIPPNDRRALECAGAELRWWAYRPACR